MKALIIANGSQPSGRIVRQLARDSDLTVCADGGARKAWAMGIKPDIILGDLDSISRTIIRGFKGVPLMFIDDQESTDLEKAILYCLRCGATSISILGGLGSRVDHSTGALGCMRRFGSLCDLELYDSIGRVTSVGKHLQTDARVGERISLIPLTRCTGIVTKNLKYPLRNESLELGVREGISNEALAKSITVSVKRGTLLLYRFKE